MSNTDLISSEKIEKVIYLIRGEKVMLDRDLASLYEVETGALNRAVKRNLQRFPPDFMFQLTTEESDLLRCQIGISKKGRGGRRFLPYVFTEQRGGDALKRAKQRTCRISQHRDAFTALPRFSLPCSTETKQIFEVPIRPPQAQL